MNISEELTEILSSRYGNSLKDAVYASMDKLSDDVKFSLKDNEEDYDRYNELMNRFFSDNATAYVLRDFLELLVSLNANTGYYSIVDNSNRKQHICYWMDMLIKELVHVANNDVLYSLPLLGDGLINGSNVRSSIYHILNILRNPDALYADTIIYTGETLYYIYGKNVKTFIIHGNNEGVGEMLDGDDFYSVTIRITDMLNEHLDYQTLKVNIGNDKLYTGDEFTVNVPPEIKTPFSIYKFTIVDFITDLTVMFTLARDSMYKAKDSDFIFTDDLVDASKTKALFYIGSYESLRMPKQLGGKDVETLGNCTFMGTNVEEVKLSSQLKHIE